MAEIANAFECAWDAYFSKGVNVDGAIQADGAISAGGEVSSSSNIRATGNIYTSGYLYDKYSTNVTNGMSAYSSSGIDPNTTLEHLILTNHANAPMGSGTFYYIVTVFYSGKSTSSNRAQYGIPYNKNGSMYHRYYSGSWTEWRRHVNADELGSFAPLKNGGTSYPESYCRTVDSVNEWINPPLVVGTEYRTVERYQGKPVYVKVYDVGTLPNNSYKVIDHGLTKTAVVALSATSANGKYYFPAGYSFSYTESVDVYINATQFIITTVGDWSGQSAYVTVKYTKD